MEGGLSGLFSCILSFIQLYMIGSKLDGIYNITWMQTFYPTLGTLIILSLIVIIMLIAGKIEL